MSGSELIMRVFGRGKLRFVIIAVSVFFLLQTELLNGQDDYPFPDSKTFDPNNPEDPETIDVWNFYNRECTSYVAHRLNQDAGSPYPQVSGNYYFHNWMHSVRWSHAENWADVAGSLGFRVDEEPEVGAVAHWHGDDLGENSEIPGHVAYVEQVNADGTVNVSEYNFQNAHEYGDRVNVIAPRYIHFVKFQQNDTVNTISSLNVRDQAGGSVVGQVDAGEMGTVLNGPQGAEYGDAFYRWYEVQWESGITGWSFEVPLRPTDSGFSDGLTAESPVFTLDLRGDAQGVAVSGRVLDANTRERTAGAEVSLAGQTRTTGADGVYSFSSVALGDSEQLTVTKDGYLDDWLFIRDVGSRRSVDVRDVLLTPTGVTAAPVVSSADLSVDGYFIEHWAEEIAATVRVNWNDNEPGEVRFFANGELKSVESGGQETYTVRFVPENWFAPSLRQGANSLSVVARSSQGVESDVVRLPITLIPLPKYLLPPGAEISSIGELEGGFFSMLQSNTLGIRATIPPEGGLHDFITLPILGEFGFSFNARGDFFYHVPTGGWNLGVGAEDIALKVGNFKGDIEIGAQAGGSASAERGLVLDDLLLESALSLSGKFRVASFGVLDLLGPGVSEALSRIRGLERALRPLTIQVWMNPSLSGEAAFVILPEWDFEEAVLSGKLAMEAVYHPDLSIAKVKMTVGGEPRVTVGLPGDLLREAGFRAYAKIGASTLRVEWFDHDYVFVDVAYSNDPERRLAVGSGYPVEGGYLLPGAGNADRGWRIMDRPHLKSGGERFLHSSGDPDRRLDLGEESSADLDLFRRMGKAQPMGATYLAVDGPDRRIASDPDLPAQAELPLLENVFTDASPSLAGREDELMLLYARDNEAEDTLHFTEIAWTFFDGEKWSDPEPVSEGEFGGQLDSTVAFDGSGRVVALWEQFGDPDYEPEGEELDLAELAGEVEIAWSSWDPAEGEWTTTELLTDNLHLDRTPRLAGPLSNGDLILTWVDNTSNRMEGEPGAESRIWWARWDSGEAQWSAPAVLLDDLVYEGEVSLGAGGDRAVLAWAEGSEGDLEDFDSEIFYVTYDALEDAWGVPVQLTETPGISNRNVRVAVADDETAHLVWKRGDDLVSSHDFVLPAETVRAEGADSLGLADFALTLGPGGNLLTIWQDMAEIGSTTHYRVFDPASETWGEDQYLSQDTDLEKSFSPVWDAMGNLTLAYVNVEIVKEDRLVELEGGEVVEIEGVPQPGRSDLLVAKRAIIRDLAVKDGSMELETEAVFPGEEATLRGTIENSGNVAVADVEAAFYLGDPDEGGELIQTHVISGWLRAGETKTIETDWIIPFGRSEVYLVVDPEEKVTQFTRDNAVSVIEVGNVDLALDLLRHRAEKDGSLRFVVEVRNIGTDPSPVTRFEVFSEKPAGSFVDPLGARNVARLEPGESLELAVELAEGTQPEGERTYYLSVDETDLLEDADRSNNSFETSVLLWIDSNDDGIPDSWYAEYGLDPEGESLAHQDLDGDGYTVWQEYLMGTSPVDASDYPRLHTSNVVYRPIDDVYEATLSWPSSEGRRYRIEYSYDLSNWGTLESGIQADPPLNSLTITAPGGEDSMFFRVTVE